MSQQQKKRLSMALTSVVQTTHCPLVFTLPFFHFFCDKQLYACPHLHPFVWLQINTWLPTFSPAFPAARGGHVTELYLRDTSRRKVRDFYIILPEGSCFALCVSPFPLAGNGHRVNALRPEMIPPVEDSKTSLPALFCYIRIGKIYRRLARPLTQFIN